MTLSFFQSTGRFWRGNLHTHSTNSDGRLSPAAVCEEYRLAGYDFLVITDHFHDIFGFPLTDTTPYRTDGFTTIIGSELHTGTTELGDGWDILGVGVPLDFARPAQGETAGEIVRRALAEGAFIEAPHPNWCTLTEQDILSLGAIHAIEIFNGTCHDDNDRGDNSYIIDLLLARGYHYNLCAVDDAHLQPTRADFMKGWVCVKSEALHPGALLTALKAGHYYSSTGPALVDMALSSDRKLTVRCSPVERVVVMGRLYPSKSVSGRGITTAEFDLSDFKSPYFRVVVRDEYGRRAYANPVWFD
ncbi:MAG: CehA/McbA family metallohydrolase [Chloroflexi bacterium]|nr:CehA/McbA family metallohydrolase [Chloroflexota bacterium]